MSPSNIKLLAPAIIQEQAHFRGPVTVHDLSDAELAHAVFPEHAEFEDIAQLAAEARALLRETKQ